MASAASTEVSAQKRQRVTVTTDNPTVLVTGGVTDELSTGGVDVLSVTLDAAAAASLQGIERPRFLAPVLDRMKLGLVTPPDDLSDLLTSAVAARAGMKRDDAWVEKLADEAAHDTD